MAYDYIGLVNDVLLDMNEVELVTGNFASAIGFQKAVTLYINRSIKDIVNQEDSEWSFQKSSATQLLTVGEDGTGTPYTLASNALRADWDSFRIQRDDLLTTSPEATKLTQIDLDVWRRTHQANEENKDSGEFAKPELVIRSLNNTIIVSPSPDLAYTIQYDYFIEVTELSASTDVPVIPEQYRQQIVDGALRYAYRFRDNFEAQGAVKKDFRDGVDSMRRNLIPTSPYMTFKS